MARKKTLGIGAVCTVGLKYLHPKKDLKDRYSNAPKDFKVAGLLAIKKDTYMVKSKPTTVVVFRHILP